LLLSTNTTETSRKPHAPSVFTGNPFKNCCRSADFVRAPAPDQPGRIAWLDSGPIPQKLVFPVRNIALRLAVCAAHRDVVALFPSSDVTMACSDELLTL